MKKKINDLCFKGDGTKETGKKIIQLLKEAGGDNFWGLTGENEVYYYIGRENVISISIYEP
jgi:hypothetical protein